MELISPVFRNGTAIPPQYTCVGQNINPPLTILKAPPKALSLVLIMHDPDAPSGDYLHWLLYDIPPSTESIAVNSVPVGAVQGLNDRGKAIYTGPCPPSGIHRYLFDLYALDKPLNLPPGSNRQQVVQTMQEHILEQTTLQGVFSTKD